jgi:hypothetical protein
MSTIGYSSWAVDLADVGAIYPFQGYEVRMARHPSAPRI